MDVDVIQVVSNQPSTLKRNDRQLQVTLELVLWTGGWMGFINGENNGIFRPGDVYRRCCPNHRLADCGLFKWRAASLSVFRARLNSDDTINDAIRRALAMRVIDCCILFLRPPYCTRSRCQRKYTKQSSKRKKNIFIYICVQEEKGKNGWNEIEPTNKQENEKYVHRLLVWIQPFIIWGHEIGTRKGERDKRSLVCIGAVKSWKMRRILETIVDRKSVV